MTKHFHTERLSLIPLNIDDATFIFHLVNTKGWIQFIGDRNILNVGLSKMYVQQLLENENINYWVVHLKKENIPIGVVTIIKKDYLPFHDIGFAFLEKYQGKGYAFEAAERIIHYAMNDKKMENIAAVAQLDNIRSIQLLEKLGFHYHGIIENNGENLNLYLFRF
ncbi:MAG: GNAT family N-acetyltransferase [Bacteroidetes bacterium]|nr:GNAT family N-acetyltransferase [Bacteroidota bacterium]